MFFPFGSVNIDHCNIFIFTLSDVHACRHISPPAMVICVKICIVNIVCDMLQWLTGRASDSRLRELGFGSSVVVLQSWASFFTLHCSRSLSCIHEYLAIDSGGYAYEQPSRINCSIWLDASQRS